MELGEALGTVGTRGGRAHCVCWCRCGLSDQIRAAMVGGRQAPSPDVTGEFGSSSCPLFLRRVAAHSQSAAPAGIWHGGSGFASTVLFPYGLHLGRSARGIPLGQFPSDLTTTLIFYPLFLLALGFSCLQLYDLIFLGAFWPFFAVIVFQPFAALIQFVRLILLPFQST